MEATADHESKDRHVLEVGTIRLQIELLRPFAKLTQVKKTRRWITLFRAYDKLTSEF